MFTKFERTIGRIWTGRDEGFEMQHIIVLEDDPDLRSEIIETLEDEFRLTGCGDIASLWHTFKREKPALVVVDLGLPDGRGSDVIRNLREISRVVGILVLSGDQSEFERVVCLELGADDYLTKPCSPRELIARVHAIIRRVNSSEAELSAQSIVEFCDYSVNLDAMEVRDAYNAPLALTTSEFGLLRVLVQHPKEVMSRGQLVGHLRGEGWVGYDRSIDGLVYRLRKKLDANSNADQLLKTVHGSGYVFTPDVTFRQ